MKFSERLALELKGCKLTQKQIAQELGIDSSNITKWKNGEYLPSLDIFYKLCNEKESTGMLLTLLRL